jgi:hypothetical protein
MQGGTVRLSVAATPGSTLMYQWRFNSTDLNGRTNANLEIPDANPNHSGSYSAVVTGESESVTSQVALVSVNIRTPCYGGYAVISSPPGFALAALPLTPGTVYTVDTVFNYIANGTTIYKLDGNGFIVNNYLFGWSDPEMNLVPGEGWFLRNPTQTNQDLLVGGSAQIGRLTNYLAAGWSVCGSPVPYFGGLSSKLAFTPPPGTKVLLFDNPLGGYRAFEMGAEAWIPSEPNIQIGQAFWILCAGEIAWRQSQNCDNSVVTTPYRVVQPQITSEVAALNFFTYNTNSSFGRVYDLDGLTPVSSEFAGQLYANTNAANPVLQPIEVPVTFIAGAGAGYIRSKAVKVAGIAGGETIHVQLRVWEKSLGTTYEMALTNGSRTGKSAVFNVVAQAPLVFNSPGLPPPDANGFPSFNVVPPLASDFRITQFSVLPDGVWLCFKSEVGKNYRGQRTNSLVPPIAWETVSGSETIAGTGGIVQIADAGTTGQIQLFYRILQLP